MTILDVKHAILGYGYVQDLDNNDDHFYTTLNLALREVNRLRPRTSTAVIVHEPFAPVNEWRGPFSVAPGNNLSFSAKARCVVLEVSGGGGVTVTGAKFKDGTRAYSWQTVAGWVRIQATADELAEISVSCTTEYGCILRNVTFFDTPFPTPVGSDVADYDLAAIVPDFDGVVLPLIRDGVHAYPGDPRGMILHGRILRLPVKERGTYEVTYKVAFPHYGDNDDAVEIPLDSELAELLPLLVAAYVWLDDDPDKAELYRARYQLAAAAIEPWPSLTRWNDKKGWS